MKKSVLLVGAALVAAHMYSTSASAVQASLAPAVPLPPAPAGNGPGPGPGSGPETAAPGPVKELAGAPTAATATATAPAARAAVPVMKSELVVVMMQAVAELRAATGKADPAAQWRILADFQYSPALRPRLLAVFGSERPLGVVSKPGAKGQTNYTATLLPHTWHDSDNLELAWERLDFNASAGKTGGKQNMTSTGTWPMLSVTGSGSRAVLRGMRIEAKQMRSASRIPYGSADMGIDSVVIDVPGRDDPPVRLSKLDAKARSTVHGKLLDVDYRLSIGAIDAGGERVEHINTAFRVLNLDAQAVTDMGQAHVEQAGLTPEQRAKAGTLEMQQLANVLAKGGVVLMVDDISASYRGNTAAIKGSVRFDKLVEKDYAAPMGVFAKLVAHFEFKLPMPLVHDLAMLFSAKQKLPPGETVESMADKMSALFVGKVVGEGYGRIENNVLRTSVDYAGGKLTANGKPLSGLNLGGSRPPQPPVPASVPVPVPAPAVEQAR